jgi:altronate hydrolase
MANSDPVEGKATARAVMRLSPKDNVAVALRPLKSGETVVLEGVAITIRRHIAVGHKFAAQAIEKGEIILKYNCPIGTAISRIAPGEYVHTHNVESNYLPTYQLPK